MSQINVSNLTFGYEGSFDNIFENVSFSLDTDWKLGFAGRNGKGKSTLLKMILEKATGVPQFIGRERPEERGELKTASGLSVSYVSQDTSFLKGSIGKFCQERRLEESLLIPAHLYIWDEPLNYIDVFSRVQIEELLLDYCPTLLAVEHDVRFREKIATGILSLDKNGKLSAEKL